MINRNRFEFFKLAARVQPIKGKFKEQFDSLSGQDRENLILDYVLAGYQPAPNLVPVKIQDPNNKDVTLTVMVMPQFFSIEGRPVQLNPVTAERVAQYYGLSLPTKEVTRAVYNQADHVVPGKPDMKLLGGSSKKLSTYTDQMLSEMSQYDIKPDDIVVGPMKELELSTSKGKLNASGLITSSGEKAKEDARNFSVVQNFQSSTGHEEKYVDYSHGVRLMKTEDPFNPGTYLSIEQLVQKAQTDSRYAPYARLADAGKSYRSYVEPGKDEDKKDDKDDKDDKESAVASSKPKPATKQPKPESTSPKSEHSQVARVETSAQPANPEAAFSQVDQFLNQFRLTAHERRRNIVKRALYVRLEDLNKSSR